MINIPNSNIKALVKIESLAWGGKPIEFFPYDFEFDDNFKPDWGSYEGFGRMDPIMTYKKTSRNITLSFNVVAENSKMARENIEKLNSLLSYLYPVYEQIKFDNQEPQAAENSVTQAQVPFEISVMQKSPLFKISFMNLLNNQDYVIAINSFKHKMKFDAADTSFSSDGNAIPGEFNINMSFTVLHNYTPGEQFPYNF